MQSTDRIEFGKVLNGMAAMRKTTLIPEALELWWACMSDWTIGDFKTAAIRVLKTTTFMPTPKDFEDLRNAGRQTAGEAFAKAVQTSKSCSQGGYMTDNVTSADPQIDRAVRALGGYRCIAMCEVDKLHFLERRFTEHYEAIQDAGDVREWLHLPRDRPHEPTAAGALAKTILRELTADMHKASGNGSS